jgi:hypothetical protein
MSDLQGELSRHPVERRDHRWVPTLAFGFADGDQTPGHPSRRFGVVVTSTGPVGALSGDVVSDDRGRLRLANLLVIPAGEGHINSNLWRAVPVAKLETVLNDPSNSLLEIRDPHMVLVIDDVEWVSEVMAADAAKRITARRRPKRKPPLILSPLPVGPRYPDTFYRKVAAAYTRLAHEHRPPAQVLADVNRVPKSTVVRWIREARRRGFLAPAGGKGRIG